MPVNKMSLRKCFGNLTFLRRGPSEVKQHCSQIQTIGVAGKGGQGARAPLN